MPRESPYHVFLIVEDLTERSRGAPLRLAPAHPSRLPRTYLAPARLKAPPHADECPHQPAAFPHPQGPGTPFLMEQPKHFVSAVESFDYASPRRMGVHGPQ